MNMKPNFSAIMQQAQKMQARMQDAQKKLESTETIGKAGATPLTVEVTKKGNQFKAVKISPALLQEESEIIEDMILAAINDAINQFDSISQKMMGEITSAISPDQLT